MVGTKVTLRVRMSAGEAHYAGELVNGSHILDFWGDRNRLLFRIGKIDAVFTFRFLVDERTKSLVGVARIDQQHMRYSDRKSVV